MLVISKTWFEILSELFVSFSAGWFGSVFIEFPFQSTKHVGLLFFRFLLGMLTLVIAKRLREESSKI